jgi:hypothetical protein
MFVDIDNLCILFYLIHKTEILCVCVCVCVCVGLNLKSGYTDLHQTWPDCSLKRRREHKRVKSPENFFGFEYR